MKTIEITKTVTEQITVEFPLYTTDGTFYYRIDESGCIGIKNNKYIGVAIEEYKNGNYPESWMTKKQITEHEFIKIWQEAQSEITLKYHSFFSKNNNFIAKQSEHNNEL